MTVISQTPQPSIFCYHSVENGEAVAKNKPYQEFSPTSSFDAGKNLQSYNFQRSIENFAGDFSFTVKEDINSEKLFMDQVRPLDIVIISESGNQESKIDFIGVITTVSIGGIASNLNKVVTVSGKSIEWLFLYYKINADIKVTVFNAKASNIKLKVELSEDRGSEGYTIKKIALGCYKMFEEQVTKIKEKEELIVNYVVGDIIKNWFGSPEEFFDADNSDFKYPITSDLFTTGTINLIDYMKKLLPPPIYEIFGFLDENGKPKLALREAPYDNPKAVTNIDPNLLTDFTLTRNCEEVYTSFMTYIEGSKQSADFYMNLAAATQGYNVAAKNEEKVKLYGYQLLTCNFVGYNRDPVKNKTGIDSSELTKLNEKMRDWFSNLDDMYNGDFTMVNLTDEKIARIGEWVGFAKGLFYVISESHSWNYGDNPMINYSVTRGGDYADGKFKRLQKLSGVYKEFDQ